VKDDPVVAVPTDVGLHHVRLPVSDVMRSRDWYLGVLGFEPRLFLEEEDHVVGVVVALRSGLTVGLHYAPAFAAALNGFCSIALSVGAHDDLTHWCTYLDALGVDHSAPAEAHLGWQVEIRDPDGHIIQLHTISGQPTADEA